MRRWFAVSGLIHAGLLAALTVCRPEAGVRPRQLAPVFECRGLDRPPAEAPVPEPEPPPPPPRDREPDAWSDDEMQVPAPEPFEEPDAGQPESVRLPAPLAADSRQLCVRLKRPVRNPRAERAEPATPAAPQVRVERPVKRPVTRAPVRKGRDTPIDYPRRARRRGIEGTVELKILVASDGRVERIVIARSSGHAILDEAARTAVLAWRFTPALRDDRPVAAWTRRTIHFRLTAPGP